MCTTRRLPGISIPGQCLDDELIGWCIIKSIELHSVNID